MAKLIFQKPDYYIHQYHDNNNLHCLIKCVLAYNTDHNPKLTTVEGVAIYARNDKFNYEVGCKIALAKAERKAYSDTLKSAKREIRRCNKFIRHKEELEKFVEKANFIIAHDDEYISNLAKSTNRKR